MLTYDEKFEPWFLSLTAAQIKVISYQLFLLENYGNELRMPTSRALGQGLFELREQKFGYRIYYSFLPAKNIIVLHGGKKDSQPRDIKIARTRGAQYAKI